MPDENTVPETTDEPLDAPQLIPHVWVQNAIPNSPPVLAGQVMTSDGRPAGYVRGRNIGWLPLPTRYAPRTQEGLDQLFDQLIADANRAMKGAA
jgi:hypothetical protein